MSVQSEVEDQTLIGLAAAAALTIFLGNLLGWWWLASPIGLMLGVLAPSRRGILAAVAAGALGWGLGVFWVAIHDPIVSTARALTTTLEMGTSPVISIVVTMFVGALLATSAAWMGRALRVLVHAQAAKRS